MMDEVLKFCSTVVVLLSSEQLNFSNVFEEAELSLTLLLPPVAQRALLQIKDVPLRTRRALLPLTLYSNSALLVLNKTSLSCNNALLALNWRYCLLLWSNIQLDLGYLATSYRNISIIRSQSCSVIHSLLSIFHSFPHKILLNTKTKWINFSFISFYIQGSTLALARLPGASKIPCRGSKISKCSNLLAQSGK